MYYRINIKLNHEGTKIREEQTNTFQNICIKYILLKNNI